MEEALTFEKIFLIAQVITIAFIIYNSYRKPQMKSDLLIALIETKFIDFQKRYEERHQMLAEGLKEIKNNDLHEIKIITKSLETKINTVCEKQIRTDVILELLDKARKDNK